MTAATTSPAPVRADELVQVVPVPAGNEVHRYQPGYPAARCGADLGAGVPAAAGDVDPTHFGVLIWCLGCFTAPPPEPSTVDSQALVCGCPYADYKQRGHRPGCWLATAEAIAVEAYTREDVERWPAGTHIDGVDNLVDALEALAEAGYLRPPMSEGQLLSLIDALTDAELLGPPAGGEPT